MRFRTEIAPGTAPFRLHLSSHLLLVGSCFSDNIGARLIQHGYIATVNPCGVQYNPQSIATLFRAALDPESVPDTLFAHDGRVRSWLLPQIFSAPTTEEARANFDAAVGSLRRSLAGCGAVILTFGTAQVWRHIPSAISAFEGTVGNCHKVPAKEFTHTMLTPDDIAEEWTALTKLMRDANPEIKLIYTVSPVRHLNPSPRLNTLSKATLHLAVERLVEADPDGSAYFPAYELLMDDLRDYRFYADDLVHPAPQAVAYVWEKFAPAVLTDEALRLLPEAEAIVAAAAHRPRNPQGEAHRAFCRRQLERIAALPEMDFQSETAYFRRCLEINS